MKEQLIKTPEKKKPSGGFFACCCKREEGDNGKVEKPNNLKKPNKKLDSPNI
jgi:hypothetical protein